MTRFWREGHFRRSQYGGMHWVEGHWVDRGDWWSGWAYMSVPAPPQNLDTRSGAWVDPNAHCPVCGAEVFFYSNELGSRVYFDDLGPPWPKHPCTDNGTADRPSATPRRSTFGTVGSGIRDSVTVDVEHDLVHIPGVFTVVSVARRGPKRVVTLQEIGGEQVEIVVSPPPPPVHAIAIAMSWELYWLDPQTGAHGKNYVWQRSETTEAQS